MRPAGGAQRCCGIVADDGAEVAAAAADLLALIGPTGSGKATLINVLTGPLDPDAGDVQVHGERTSGRAPHIYAAMGVARTFQLTQLFGRMTVLENMLVPGLTRAHSTWPEVTRRAHRYLDFLKLSHLERLQAKNLSGGQQKLLELGRC